MSEEKDCYFCKNLCYVDDKSAHEFICTLNSKHIEISNPIDDCECYVEDMEE